MREKEWKEWNEYQKENNILTHGNIYCGIPLKRDIVIILKDGNIVEGEFQDVVLSVNGNDIIYIKDEATVRNNDIKDIMLIEDYEKEGD